MKQINQVLEVLEEGPDNSGGISIELGLPLKTVSAVLCELRNCGVVKVIGKIRQGTGRPKNIWQLASQLTQLEN